LPTKARISSNCSSVVRGGKSHEIVVKTSGVRAGELAVPGHGGPIDPAEPTGLADATPLGDVLQDRLDLRRGESGIEEGRPLAFGEAGLADPAAEHAFGLAGAVVCGDGEVFGVPLAMVGAGRTEAAEARQVVHDASPMVRSPETTPSCVTDSRMTVPIVRCNDDPLRPRYRRDVY